MRFLRPAVVLLLVLAAGLPAWGGGALMVGWPPLVALVSIVLLRHAGLGLLAGGLAGALILADGRPWAAVKAYLAQHLFGSLDGTWPVAALVFTLLLGAFAGVLEAGGGFDALVRRLTARIRQPRRDVGLAAVALGFICFFDGLANSLLVGRLMRPLADRHGVSRAKLAYLVDSTSAPVACLAFISTWIATQLSLIDAALAGTRFAGQSYPLFFRSIPANYYCLFTLALAALVAWRGWNLGAMRRFETVAASAPVPDPPAAPVPLRAAIVPLATLVLAIPATFYLWDTSPLWPVTPAKLGQAFSGSAGPYALTLGSLLGLAAALACTPAPRRTRALDGARLGAAAMLGPLSILVAAWALGSVLRDLGTATHIAGMLARGLAPTGFPAAVFVTGAVAAFVTGTSWGTMALMMPLALPVAAQAVLAGTAPEALLPLTIAAVFSGAVFGDHCSPVSDTTIVSAFASGISTLDHTLTQLPYALVCATLAVAAFLAAAALGHPAAPLAAGLALLAAPALRRPSR